MGKGNETYKTRREKAVAFIVARLGSSRLPAKQFRNIGDRTLIDWIFDELRKCGQLDEIVLATVAEPTNEPLRDWCVSKGIACYWYEGETDHVTTRLRKAAEEFGADICVLVSGDCPLIYAPAIDRLISELRLHPDADLIRVKKDEAGTAAALQGIGVARRRAWQRADDLSDRPELKEHQFPVIGQRPDLFQAHECGLDDGLYHWTPHRLSVDTWADLEFMNAVYHALKSENKPFSLPYALDVMKRNPRLLEINRHVHQMGVGEKRKNVLMIVDAGNGFGYGHLMRSRELALQIIERLGWPVTFLVNDDRARKILEQVGIRSMDDIIGHGSWIMGHGAGTKNVPADQHVGQLIDSFDLVMLDIYCQRQLKPGWRKKLPPGCKVMVLDRLEEWAEEADLIVIPGVTYNEATAFSGTPGPKILLGADYIILRREIRRLQGRDIPRDLDALAYLHLPEQRDVVEGLARQNGYKVYVVHGFEDNFSGLLSRSRLFISGFGYSFYEALALGAWPVTWPLSDFHRADARKFYARLGLDPLIVTNADEVKEVIKSVRNTQSSRLKAQGEKEALQIQDGTPRIVAEMASMFNTQGH